jgi:crotonobetainyl-CoA:carnitine CoA-transferase CaiB-like acyl-CoA transferase
MAGALEHLRILDLSDDRASLTGRLLAELGADVVKIERSGGSPERFRPPFKGHVPHAEGSLHYLYFNSGKRNIGLDLDGEADRATFRDLVRSADAVIESFEPGYLPARGLGYEDLRALNEAIVLTSVTPFGQTGPRSAWRGGDLIANAAGGMTYIVGDPDAAPATPPTEQNCQMAGVHAAWGTLLALYDRWGSGLGQHVDVSMQEVAAHQFFMLARYSAPDAVIVGRTGAASGIVPNTVYPCKDGLVRISIFEARQYRSLVEWIGDPEIASPEFDLREVRAAAADLINERIATWTSQHTVTELLDGSLEHRIPMAPMNTPAEFVQSVYATHRELFVEDEHPHVGRYRVPKPYLNFSTTPVRRGAPARHLDEDGAAVRAEIPARRSWRPAGAPHLDVGAGRPFEGIRILDFTRVWSGPVGTRFMADLGAEVIKVESNKRPDSRPDPNLPPELAIQSSCYFAENNRNKHGIAVDLTTERGRELIRQLAARCDVVTENNSPGVMDRLGIGYDDLRQVNPGLVFVSMPGFGAGTPHSSFPAYGGTLMCYLGMSYLWGLPESEPANRCQLAYPDYITAAHVPVATLAALHHRARTGEGQHVEIAQIDGAASFMGTAYLDHFVNGADPQPAGNHSEWAAPHGVYRCHGDDRWVAISVENDVQWRALGLATANPNWLEDTRFATPSERLANRAALDALIEGWTAQFTPMQCARILQAQGVPAAPVQTGEDLYLDPHLRDRGFVLPIEHPGLGRFEHSGMTVRLSASPGTVRRPAPQLGANTVEVFTRILEMPEAEARALVAEGVLA